MISLLEARRAGLLSHSQWLPNIVAGALVRVVASPLAIPSAARPEQGVYVAILAGVLVSIFGGSPLQIAGLHRVPFMDITGIQTPEEVMAELHERGVKAILCEGNTRMLGKLLNAGVLTGAQIEPTRPRCAMRCWRPASDQAAWLGISRARRLDASLQFLCAAARESKRVEPERCHTAALNDRRNLAIAAPLLVRVLRGHSRGERQREAFLDHFARRCQRRGGVGKLPQRARVALVRSIARIVGLDRIHARSMHCAASLPDGFVLRDDGAFAESIPRCNAAGAARFVS